MENRCPFSPSVYPGEALNAPASSLDLYPEARWLLQRAFAEAAARPVLGNASGEIVLLRSADAGAGKTHLLAEAIAQSKSTCHSVVLVFDRGCEPSWTALLRDSLVQLAQQPPAAGEVNPLSASARRLFAELLSDLLSRGQIPTTNPAKARRSLELNGASLLDLRGASPVAAWFRDNAQALFDPLAASLARHIDLDAARSWIEILYRFELHGELPPVADLGETKAKALLRDLGRIVGRYRPLVFVFDHLDALHEAPAAALSASFLFCELARSEIAPLTVVAINDEVLDGTLLPACPSAVADRIREREIRLRGIGRAAALNLIEARLAASQISAATTERFVRELDLKTLCPRPDDAVTPRAALRYAAAGWAAAQQADCSAPGAHPALPHDPSPPTRESLLRIREMLHDVNQRRSGNEAPPSPFPDLPDDAPPTLRDFAAARDACYRDGELLFDPVAIRRALELAGRRSPLLDYTEITDLPHGGRAAAWRSPDGDILFGFEPSGAIDYWKALVDQASSRSKVVAFTPPDGEAFELTALNGSAREHLDVLQLDRCALASIAAADRVASRASNAEEAFALIAPELDSLWRRVTRPLEALES